MGRFCEKKPRPRTLSVVSLCWLPVQSLPNMGDHRSSPGHRRSSPHDLASTETGASSSSRAPPALAGAPGTIEEAPPSLQGDASDDHDAGHALEACAAVSADRCRETRAPSPAASAAAEDPTRPAAAAGHHRRLLVTVSLLPARCKNCSNTFFTTEGFGGDGPPPLSQSGKPRRAREYCSGECYYSAFVMAVHSIAPRSRADWRMRCDRQMHHHRQETHQHACPPMYQAF